MPSTTLFDSLDSSSQSHFYVCIQACKFLWLIKTYQNLNTQGFPKDFTQAPNLALHFDPFWSEPRRIGSKCEATTCSFMPGFTMPPLALEMEHHLACTVYKYDYCIILVILICCLCIYIYTYTSKDTYISTVHIYCYIYIYIYMRTFHWHDVTRLAGSCVDLPPTKTVTCQLGPQLCWLLYNPHEDIKAKVFRMVYSR